jgi:hypothetical protein
MNGAAPPQPARCGGVQDLSIFAKASLRKTPSLKRPALTQRTGAERIIDESLKAVFSGFVHHQMLWGFE